MKEIFVGNNCVTGFYYKINGIQFNMPFVFCWIGDSDYFCLVKNFLKLNYLNVKFNIEYNNVFKRQPYVSCMIDNCVKLHFIHHIYDPKKEKIFTTSDNVYYKHIIDLVKEKYERRTNRMLDLLKQPNITFIYAIQQNQNKSLIQYQPLQFDLIDTQFKKIILTYDQNTYFDIRKNLKTPCYLFSGNFNTKDAAKKLTQGLKNGQIKL